LQRSSTALNRIILPLSRKSQRSGRSKEEKTGQKDSPEGSRIASGKNFFDFFDFVVKNNGYVSTLR
jgi:hypothetical protein